MGAELTNPEKNMQIIIVCMSSAVASAKLSTKYINVVGTKINFLPKTSDKGPHSTDPAA